MVCSMLGEGFGIQEFRAGQTASPTPEIPIPLDGWALYSLPPNPLKTGILFLV